MSAKKRARQSVKSFVPSRLGQSRVRMDEDPAMASLPAC